MQPAVRNERLELWRDAGQRDSGPTETMGWITSPTSPENKRVKNTSLEDSSHLGIRRRKKSFLRGEEMRNKIKR